MNKENIKQFEEEYNHKARMFYLWTLFPLTFFLIFIPLTRKYVFIIYMLMLIKDMELTNKIVIKNNGTELNPFPKLFMKLFKKYWFIPYFIVASPIIYFISMYHTNANPVLFFMGVWLMVIWHNYNNANHIDLIEKYKIKIEYKERK